jgi:hypothetical protein
VTTDPCDFCGGWDAIRKRRRHPRTGAEIVKVDKLMNFEQDARMLPGMPEEAALQRPLDE